MSCSSLLLQNDPQRASWPTKADSRMIEDYTLRSGQLRDIPEMVLLLEELFSLEDDFEFAPDRARRGLQMLLESGTSWICVAERMGRVVGLCTMQKLISTSEGGEVGLIEDVVVASECRGMGIGRSLLTEAERHASAAGLRRLQLLADRENLDAQEFYSRLQWQETKLLCRQRLLRP